MTLSRLMVIYKLSWGSLAPFLMSKAGERLIESAQQAVDFVEGTADATEYRIHIPEEIDVKHIREGLHRKSAGSPHVYMSQSEFAEYFGFSIRTLQEWEQGRSVPRGVAKNFLILLQRDPDMVRSALTASPLPSPEHPST